MLLHEEGAGCCTCLRLPRDSVPRHVAAAHLHASALCCIWLAGLSEFYYGVHLNSDLNLAILCCTVKSEHIMLCTLKNSSSVVELALYNYVRVRLYVSSKSNTSSTRSHGRRASQHGTISIRLLCLCSSPCVYITQKKKKRGFETFGSTAATLFSFSRESVPFGQLSICK